jgi:hypothetical protein
VSYLKNFNLNLVKISLLFILGVLALITFASVNAEKQRTIRRCISSPQVINKEICERLKK